MNRTITISLVILLFLFGAGLVFSEMAQLPVIDGMQTLSIKRTGHSAPGKAENRPPIKVIIE